MTALIPAWMDSAACRLTMPEVFFPLPGASARAAKDICLRCPVATTCLSYALDHESTWGAHGVWGGLTAKERVWLRRRLNHRKAAS